MGGDDELTFSQKAAAQWNGFKSFMWDGEKKEFMGRSGNSWAKIGLFYFVYYTFLACFWAAMLFIFLQTVSDDKPTWTAYVSTPGLNYAPSLDENEIFFTPDNPDTYKKLTAKLTEVYNSINATGQRKEDCTDPRCEFDVDQLGAYCTPPHFGYDLGEPCVLVNLNRVYNWSPEEYAEGEVPEEVEDRYQPGNIAFACEPYKDKYADAYNDSMVYPPQGIPFTYFPFLPKEFGGKKNYATPWVAIRFKVKFNMDAKIACRTYTSNIKPKNGLYDTDQESKFAVTFNIKKEAGKDEL